MANERNNRTAVLTTAELRKNLSDALGRAHFQRDVVRVSHHGRRYAAVVSSEDADAIELLEQLRARHGSERLDLFLEKIRALEPGKVDQLWRRLEGDDEVAPRAGRNAKGAA